MSSLNADKLVEHQQHAEKALADSNYSKAFFHTLKAAEFCLRIAEQSTVKIARQYIKEAFSLIETAEELKKKKKKKGKPDGGQIAPKAQKENQEEKESSEEWLMEEKPNVRFTDIAGMEEAKDRLAEMLIEPIRNLDQARNWGIQPGGGILLFGPPGTGKTTFAKAVAGELDVPFFYASGAQIRSKWYGESEKKLRQFIRSASSHPVAVLFFDDLDGLFSRRSSGSAVDNRLVTQFLAEKGGFDESSNVLLLLGATNRPWEIDEAVFRTGRFDMKLYIGLPDSTARETIIGKSLGVIPLSDDVQIETLVTRTDGYTGSDIVALVHAGKRSAFKRSIAGGLDKLTAEDLDRAFQSIPSSVTPELMARYQEFNEKRFR